MLSITKIRFFSLLLIFTFLFVGCVRKRSTYDYSRNYDSNYNTSSNSNYKTSSNSKMRNSKAMHRATMNSYNVFGKWYYPKMVDIGTQLTGIASWYGPNFHAKKTSNGETYDMYGMTAAHKTLPMNTMVKVYNLDNNKTIIVRINDRGPFVKGRIIDLSNKAAHDVAMVGRGTANVKVVVLGFNGVIGSFQEASEAEKQFSKYYLQIGAFSKIDGAKNVKRKFDLILEDRYNIIIKKSDDLNKVWISGFKSEAEAKKFKEDNNLVKATIIVK